MATAKKVKPVKEENTELPETTPEQPEITQEETPVEEVPEEIPTPEKIEESIVEEKPVEKIVIPVAVIKDDATMEQKIINFIDSRDGDIKMNDFLKSLFPLPKHGEPPTWLGLSAMRSLRGTLDGMKKRGEINILNDNHLRLGDCYYPDTTTMKTHHYNLNTVPIVAKK